MERAQARPQLNSEKKKDLRASHWFVGQSQPTPINLLNSDRAVRNTQSMKTLQPLARKPDSAFITSSMINYKWVQPYPSRKSTKF